MEEEQEGQGGSAAAAVPPPLCVLLGCMLSPRFFSFCSTQVEVNQLTGTIPAEYGSLGSLVRSLCSGAGAGLALLEPPPCLHASLSANRTPSSRAPIPTPQNWLRFGSNKFVGRLPDTFAGTAAHLNQLTLDENDFEASVAAATVRAVPASPTPDALSQARSLAHACRATWASWPATPLSTSTPHTTPASAAPCPWACGRRTRSTTPGESRWKEGAWPTAALTHHTPLPLPA